MGAKKRRHTEHDQEDASRAKGVHGRSRGVDYEEILHTGSVSDGQIAGKEGPFQTGAVVRVKLINFVTYNEIEFFLGQSLNMITGPNGSGKSSFVCALCLGLFGKPELLGRSSNLADFVKLGTEEATIEIEIQTSSSDNKNTVITRKIQKNGNSDWYLNGSRATSSAIKQQIKKFQFQIDNLCQFLPQDKVTAFAQMSPQELLLSTERATGNDNLVIWHNKLKDLSKRLTEANATGEADRTKLDRLVEEQKEADKVRQELENTERIREDLRLYSAMLPFAQLRHYESQFELIKVSIDEVEQQISDFENKIAPVEQYIGSCSSAGDLSRAQQNQAQNDKYEATKRYHAKIEELQDLAETAKSHCDLAGNTDEKKRQYEKVLADMQHRVQNAEANKQRHLMSKPEDSEIEEARARSDEMRAQNRELRESMEAMDVERQSLENELQRYQNRLKQKNFELKQLGTLTARRMVALRQADERSARAVEFFDRESERFKLNKPVLKPALLSLKINNSKCLKQVNQVIRRHHLTAFITQDYNDYLRLSKILNDSKHGGDTRVNIFDFSSANNSFSHPIKRSDLKKYGFDGYLIDLLEADEPTMIMLQHEAKIHTIPYSSRPLTSSEREAIHNLRNPDGSFVLQSYLDSESFTAMSISKYGKREATTTYVRLREPFAYIQEIAGRLTSNSDGRVKEEVQQLERSIERLQEKRQDIDLREEECRENMINVETAMSQYRVLREKLSEWATGLTKYESFINTKKDELETAIANKPDFERARLQGIKDYQRTIEKIKRSASEAAVLFDGILACEKKSIKNQISNIRLQTDVKILKNLTGRDKENLVKDLNRLQGELEKKQRKAEEYRKMLAEKYSSEALAEAEKKLYEMHPVTEETNWEELVDEVRKAKNRLNAELELSNDNRTNIRHLMMKYNERAEMIAALTEKLRSENNMTESLTSEIEQVRHQWEPELEKLISNVSEKFADSLQAINCEGRVELYKGQSDEQNFAEWAVHIKVSFRIGGELQLLTSQRQSGGERAVSTVLYLMALQNQTTAPFRVVDEINQGMDGANERMVHNRMVDISCTEDTSQYFLITPKLLTDLKYDPKMKVMCIFSSDTVGFAGDSSTTTRSFLSKLRKLR